jgi:hypothetical protein
MKVTLKYCKELLNRHPPAGDVADGSGCIDPEFVRSVLEEAKADDRFRVSYDHASYTDDEDTWDLIGPACKYGIIFYGSRQEAEADRDALNCILREHLGPVSRIAMYTSEAHLARCLIDRGCCPACGSVRTEVNENMFVGSGGVAVFSRGCGDCNAEWTENYLLQGYKDLRMD